MILKRSSTISKKPCTHDPVMEGDLHSITSIPTRPPSPIDVDSLPDYPLHTEKTISNSINRPCEGFVVDLPHGISPHSAYPFGLHDELGDPWDYSVTQGILVLRARCCENVRVEGTKQCRGCKLLAESSLLKGVLDRLRMGVHENVRLVYHGVGGLAKIVRQKNGQVQALRL